ncbi:hypothetical protein PIB30_101687 [Stylosanthes scabra]|uniref:Uncharacterized protein n=1 Tax=Stylosanthes scabra TaxID=79078 RepID=A0ABU6QZ11_9FABA|nr:hypothetical protein [Stylosanthes scabra]
MVSARLRIRSPARGRTLTLPSDIRPLHPRLSSSSGGIARILQQAIRGQEPTPTGNLPPVSVFPGWPTGVAGGYDLNLMISGPPVVPEVVPVCKLMGPPLIVTDADFTILNLASIPNRIK